jgi:hypothetical protein
MPAVLILDRNRALDFLIACSTRADVPEQFSRLQAEPANDDASALIATPAAAGERAPEAESTEAVREPIAPARSSAARPAEAGRAPRSTLAGWWRGFAAPVAWPR